MNVISTGHRRVELASTNEPIRLKQEILNLNAEQHHEERQFERSKVSSISIDRAVNLERLSKSVNTLIHEIRSSQREINIIDSLRFEAMMARHSRIIP